MDKSWIPSQCINIDKNRIYYLKGINKGLIDTQVYGDANGSLPYVISSNIPINLVNPTNFALSQLQFDFVSKELAWKFYNPFTKSVHIFNLGYKNQHYMPKDLLFSIYSAILNTNNISASLVNKEFSMDQINRAYEVRRLHYALAHPSDSTLTNALRNGVIIGTRLTAKDVTVYRKIFGPCPGCLAGKVTVPSYKKSLALPADRVGRIVHIDLIPFSCKTLGGNNYYLLFLDEFSTYLHAFGMKNKSHDTLITAIDLMISYFLSYNHTIQCIHADHESNIISTKKHLGFKNILLKNIAPYQHAQKIERYKRTINDHTRSIIHSTKFKIPPKLYGELLLTVLQTINWLPNTNQPIIAPTTIFKGTKLNLAKQTPAVFGTYAALHIAEKAHCLNDKTLSHTENGIILRLCDDDTSNVLAWIPGKTICQEYNKYTVIRALPEDFKLEKKEGIILSHIPDFIPITKYNEEGEPNSKLETTLSTNNKPHIFLQTETMSNSLGKQDKSPIMQTKSNNGIESSDKYTSTIIKSNFILEGDNDNISSQLNNMLISPDETISNPTTFSQQMNEINYSNNDTIMSQSCTVKENDKVFIKTTSSVSHCIQEKDTTNLNYDEINLLIANRLSVKKAMQGPNALIAQRAIRDEIKNMMDYKVGQYVNWDAISWNEKQHSLRSFMFLKEKFHASG